MNPRPNELVDTAVAVVLVLVGVGLAALLATPPLLGGPVDPVGGSTMGERPLLRLVTWGAVVVAALAGGYVLYEAAVERVE